MFTAGHRNYVCPLELSLSIISGKWKGVIIWFLLENKVLRYGEIKKKINTESTTGITEKMLIQSLKELENDGIIERKAYPEVPPKVEYTLTATGKNMSSIIFELEKFGMNFMEKPLI